MFENQTCLITGGTGSWGRELTRRLLENSPKEIRIFSRNEFAQVEMQRQFADCPELKFIIGDIRDYAAVEQVCRGVDYVFHLAALKHVPICEKQPNEALKTNVMGTQNVVRASIVQRVKKVLDVSTDKAVDPINVYGITKAIGERIMIQANEASDDTRFVCIRGGNVLGTNGSVVPFFRQRMEAGLDIPITAKNMTRFFLTLAEAIELLLEAARVSLGGETFVMKMNAYRIMDLAEVMVDALATKPVQIREIGVRPGEKTHEVLISHYESKRTHAYGKHYYVISPFSPSPSVFECYRHLPEVNFACYDSSQNLLAQPDIWEMLRKGGFLS